MSMLLGGGASVCVSLKTSVGVESGSRMPRRNKLLLRRSGGFLLVVSPPSPHLFHVPASLEGSAQLELAERVEAGSVNLFAVPNLMHSRLQVEASPSLFSPNPGIVVGHEGNVWLDPGPQVSTLLLLIDQCHEDIIANVSIGAESYDENLSKDKVASVVSPGT
eukprot:973662-Rhodomonas_salina.2